MSLGKKKIQMQGAAGITATDHFTPKIYTGNGSTQSITGLDFQPDLVWIKSRSDAYFNFLIDSVRGAGKEIYSNESTAEQTNPNISSFDTNGFTLTSRAGVNNNSSTYVAWCWKGGGSAVSNTDGDITSNVSANPDAGFSIVKYTGVAAGVGSGGATPVGHGLSSAPELVIYKRFTGDADDWYVVFKEGSQYKAMYLNYNFAAFNQTNDFTATTIHTYRATTNDLIAYCFHSVDGYQKIGSYSGSGSSDVSVSTGFRPRFVMIKRTDVASQTNPDGGGTAFSNWFIWDSARDNTNPSTLYLMANVSNAESSNLELDFDDNGFTVGGLTTGGYWAATNASGGTYIYLAIA